MKCPLTQRPLAFPCPGLYRVFPRTFPGAFPYTLAFFIPLSFIYPCVFMCFSLHSSIRNSVRCALTYRWASCHFFCLIFHAIRRSTLRSLIYPLQCFYRAFSHLFPVRSAMCPGWFLPKFSFHPWRFSLCMCTSVWPFVNRAFLPIFPRANLTFYLHTFRTVFVSGIPSFKFSQNSCTSSFIICDLTLPIVRRGEGGYFLPSPFKKKTSDRRLLLSRQQSPCDRPAFQTCFAMSPTKHGR